MDVGTGVDLGNTGGDRPVTTWFCGAVVLGFLYPHTHATHLCALQGMPL